jgi:ribA/ribD-fused uncharacterized protein
MFAVILMLKNSGDIAVAGRSYEHSGHQGWLNAWLPGWQQVVRIVLRRALYSKFAQNPDLRELLLKTGDHMLVECAPKDKNCGIGYSAQDALKNKEDWGLNLLGELLMEVRGWSVKQDKYTGGYDAVYSETEHKRVVRKKWASREASCGGEAQHQKAASAGTALRLDGNGVWCGC